MKKLETEQVRGSGPENAKSALTEQELLVVVTGSVPTSFLATVDGQTEPTWTPRAYAVQSDLSGGVTGARAGLYEWRKP